VRKKRRSKKSLNMVLSAIANYEDIGLKSLLIATIIAMGVVIRYLYTSKETALNEKKEKAIKERR
jgi:hypothetical protein